MRPIRLIPFLLLPLAATACGSQPTPVRTAGTAPPTTSTSTTTAPVATPLPADGGSIPIGTAELISVHDGDLRIPVPHVDGLTVMDEIRRDKSPNGVIMGASFRRPWKQGGTAHTVNVSTLKDAVAAKGLGEVADAIDAKNAHRIESIGGRQVIVWAESDPVPAGGPGMPASSTSMYLFVDRGRLVEVIFGNVPEAEARTYVATVASEWAANS